MTSFPIALGKTLVSGFRRSVAHNVDPFRFPGRTRPDRTGVRSSARTLVSMLGKSRDAAASRDALADDESKRLLLELCAFRVAGGRHYRLPRNDAAYWRAVAAVQNELVVERGVSRACGYELDLYRVDGAGGPIELEAHPMNVLNTFLVEEYRFARGGVTVEAEAGDVVVDAGGCWGDTALYFADRVGERGKVFAFEFEDHNLEVLRRNLARNPRLAPRIEVVERAVWSGEGTVSIAAAGPATRVGGGAGGREVRATSIDAWASEAGVREVGFLKMDIEGAETPALAGARETIAACAPKLAISIYHSVRDLVTIPALLRSMRADYAVYLGHATIHAEETIAFARVG